MAETVKNTDEYLLKMLAGDHQSFRITFTAGGSPLDLTNGKLKQKLTAK
jgi:hypothetical protein